jgi:hypothetical protein
MAQGKARGNERADSAKNSIYIRSGRRYLITKPKGRKCKYPGCITLLSKHNISDNYCYAHQRKVSMNILGYISIENY